MADVSEKVAGHLERMSPSHDWRWVFRTHRHDYTRTRAREGTSNPFTVVFYGAILRNALGTDVIMFSSETQSVQRGENGRKTCVFNYESPALTAELQAHLPMKIADST
jgi:hypothetical protein